MVLLDKLLPKLQAEGHRVLLFSQFKGLLSLLVRACATDARLACSRARRALQP